RMRHGSRMAGERLGAAEADRQLEYLQRVEEGKGSVLAALDVEGKGRARTRALAAKHFRCRVALLQERQVGDPIDLGVIGEVAGDGTRIAIRLLHADGQRLQ